MKKLPKINMCCSKDVLRPSLGYIEITKSTIVATNGNIMVVNKTNEVFEQEFITKFPYKKFYIHESTWREMHKGRIYWKGNTIVVCKSNGEFRFKVIANPEWKYPNWKNFVSISKEDVDVIGINPLLLYRLYQALPNNTFNKLTFCGKTKHIIVESVESKYKSFGIIMPIILNI